jgi:predicted nucleic acid-binding protein
MSEFLDTSVIVRVLTGDNPVKAARGLALFQRAQRGEAELVTSESVVAEVVYVLGSPVIYRLPRPDVARALRPVLSNNGLRLDHKQSVLAALDRWERTRLDFEDCLSVEHMQRQKLDGIYSYDRDFDRVPEVRRLEP